jgi:hypothetical protein
MLLITLKDSRVIKILITYCDNYFLKKLLKKYFKKIIFNLSSENIKKYIFLKISISTLKTKKV